MNASDAWTETRPAQPGYFEVWDPRRGINRIVRVFRARDGRLAVRNFCRCKYAFLVDMWALPAFAGTHWRGPLVVPDALPADLEHHEGCALPHCDHAEGDAQRA